MVRMRAEFVGPFGRHECNFQIIEPRLRIVLTMPRRLSWIARRTVLVCRSKAPALIVEPQAERLFWPKHCTHDLAS
jgi:hypothetical protein